MKKSIITFRKVGLLATSLLGTTAFAQTQQPNIILFLVDDMGWQDTSVPFWTEKTRFNELYETPNMEVLASQGMKFTQAYASAISSPTRVSLFTGMNPARHRVTNWTLRQNSSNDDADSQLNFPLWNVNGLQPEGSPQISRATYATPLPKILKNSGYYTIHCGKGHLGVIGTAGEELKNFGFDVNIAGSAIGGPGSYLSEHSYSSVWRGDMFGWQPIGMEAYYAPGAPETNLTEAITQEALKALNNRDNSKPFYLYMSHYGIHVPIEKDDRFYQKYINKGMVPQEAAYASMIEGMDKSLGDLMKWLDDNNQAENTIILFMSDNGGWCQSTGVRLRGGSPHTLNAPLKSGKGSAYEGGIREPMLVKWVGKVEANSVSDELVIIEDFFPSILEMGGVDISTLKTMQTIDGKSFNAILGGAENPNRDRDLFWHFPNKTGSGPGVTAFSIIRSGDFKLIYFWASGTLELYNIKEDIGETNNLLHQYPELYKEMADKLTNYLKSVDAQRPTYKSNGQIVPWPNEAKVPTAPVEPKISNDLNDYWYKIHDNRTPNYFWRVDNAGKLVIVTEPIPNDTTTVDKLFRLKLATDGTGYEIYSRTNPDVPISAANTNDYTVLTIHSTNPIKSWVYSASSAVPAYYHIAAETDNKQLNSYYSNGGIVSFWMPDGDVDPGNRWAFIPGFLRGALTDYPDMKRYFTNPTVPHEQAQSRYLTSVKVKVNGIEKDIIGPNAENPTDYAVINQPNVNYPGAVVDARNPQIVVTTADNSFELTCLGSTVNTRNLQWTQQNVFIDWNQDFDFLDANEAGERTSTTTPNTALITAPGYTRTIHIPTGTPAGIYRIRLIYHEPENSTDWTSSIWSNNVVRNGIAYDFGLKIQSTTSVNSLEVLENRIRVENGRIFVDGVSQFEIFSIEGKKLNTKSKFSKGIYIVKSEYISTKVVIK